MAAPHPWDHDSLGWGAIFMLTGFPVMIIVGSALCFLSGIGVGGGSLLMLWLTLILNVEHQAARLINLLFFIPSALIASVFRWRQGKLNFQKILPAIIAGCICAAIFSLISRSLDVTIIKKLFGALMLLIGIKELFYRARNAR